MNHARKDGIDALFMASGGGHEEVVRALLAHGATGIARALAVSTNLATPDIFNILFPLCPVCRPPILAT